jgi:hypothetical protein
MMYESVDALADALGALRLQDDLTAGLPENFKQRLDEALKTLTSAGSTADRDAAAMAAIALVEGDEVRARVASLYELAGALAPAADDEINLISTSLGESPTLPAILAATAIVVDVDPDVDPITRTIKLSPHGKGGGRSLKIKNIWLNRREVFDRAVGAVAPAGGGIPAHNHLLIAASVLIAVRAAGWGVKIRVTQDQAVVLCGLIDALLEGPATEAAVRHHANAHRQQIGLNRLTGAQLRATLDELAAIGAVERNHADGTWSLREKARIRSS